MSAAHDGIRLSDDSKRKNVRMINGETDRLSGIFISVGKTGLP